MGNRIDNTYKIGDKVARLTIMSEPFVIDGQSRVKVLCDCGRDDRIIRVRHIKTGKTRSCGCLYKDTKRSGPPVKYRIKVGEKYGMLTILATSWRYYTTKGGSPARMETCTCKCDCGTVKEGIYKSNILLGKILSCGCLRIKVISSKRASYTAGQKIGIYTLIEEVSRGATHLNDRWLASCECGVGNKVLGISSMLKAKCKCLGTIHAGKTFNHLTVIRAFQKDSNQFAEVLCACGNTKEVRLSSVTQGLSKTCGCGYSESVKF